MNGKKLIFLAACVLLSGSCSKVKFETENNNNPGGGGNGTVNNLGTISCSTYFNNNLSSVTVGSAAQNPTVHADCTPSGVNISWMVRNASNSAVTINGLQGAHSTADFFSAGNGTYSVTATATASGYANFTSTPITALVQNSSTGNPAITCTLSINGQSAPITIPPAPSNPRAIANCSAPAGNYVWTVVYNGNTVTIPGLSGSDSYPNFAGQPAGKYELFVQVSQPGYTPYTTATPLVVNIAPPTTKPVTTTKTVTAENNQLDILLVVDDSKSMLADNLRLASRLQGFVTDLSNAGFDWQMCTTVTRAQQLTSSNPTLYWGASVYWKGNPASPTWILKSGTSNINQIFTETIDQIGAGWQGTDDERGIKAAWWHIYNGEPQASGNSGCYRQNAALSMIFLSDEDERSIGGDISQRYYADEYKALENDDQPQTLIDKVKSVFGNSKRFVANSIIVRPGDSTCLKQQDDEGSKAHYGTKYAELSQLTGGYIASICDSDYYQSLKYFKDKIVLQMKSMKLDCIPAGTPTVSISPNFTHTFTVQGDSIVFDPAIPVGRTITVNYQCPL